MNNQENDTPGVIALPPVIYLAFFLIGLALGYLWPAGFFPEDARRATGIAIVAVSGVIVAASLWGFKKAGTSFRADRPSTALITGGLFRFSRNPIYVSSTLLYAGVAILLDNLWVFLLLVPLHIVVHYGVIVREERYLERKFGEEYVRYKTTVRRWI
jgi:protein-S-isoprenylcysteine O-methyltransferase Ste14